MEYICIFCSNDPERQIYIKQLIEDFKELVYKKYPDCVILKGDVKVRFFTDLERKIGQAVGYGPHRKLDFYDQRYLAKILQEIYERKINK